MGKYSASNGTLTNTQRSNGAIALAEPVNRFCDSRSAHMLWLDWSAKNDEAAIELADGCALKIRRSFYPILRLNFLS